VSEKIEVVKNVLALTTEEVKNHLILTRFIISSLRHVLTEI